jgi:hypothetical protein
LPCHFFDEITWHVRCSYRAETSVALDARHPAFSPRACPWRRLATIAALLPLLSDCGSALPGPDIAHDYRDVDEVEVPFPPPPSKVEMVPEKPVSAAVWVDGSWSWNGRRWAWEYGYWALPPKGATYSPWRTVQKTDGTLIFEAAIWRDERGVELPSPPLASPGKAHEGNVVAPEGQTEHTAPNKIPEPGTPPPVPSGSTSAPASAAPSASAAPAPSGAPPAQ